MSTERMKGVVSKETVVLRPWGSIHRTEILKARKKQERRRTKDFFRTSRVTLTAGINGYF